MMMSMKVIRFYCIGLCLMMALEVNAEVQNNWYEEAMRPMTEQLASVKDVDGYLQSRNRLERIAGMYADEWLPVYYMAYCDIQLAYFRHADASAYMDEARTLIETLDNFAAADRSEVNTLWGYYYTAHIAANPEKGAQIYGKAIESYSKAIADNPNNPRPVCLLAFFRSMMPPMMRSDAEIADGKARAKNLFDAEKASWNRPSWGSEYLNMIKTTDK
jgi:tetratricopeptide (TPR) repeat protein